MAFNYEHGGFVCGHKNPAGLGLRFVREDNGVSTVFIPPQIYQGYPGVLHGGITSTVFDEVMSQCLWAEGRAAFTARLTVRFRKNIPVEKPVKFKAWLEKERGRLVDVKAEAFLADGQIAAEAQARFMLIENK